jgi:23S rRNA (uridine2552-2'-O)-methyltransferase
MAIKDRSRLDDHYSRLARKEGFPARSVFKLAEFDRKKGLFKPGQRVLDLGCAPGGWTLYAAGQVGPKGLVVGVDLVAPSGVFPPQVSLLAADVLSGQEALTALRAKELKGGADAVMSDLAPRTTGRREVDQAKSLELAVAAWVWAQELLAAGGWFLFKVFQSPAADEFIGGLKAHFERESRLKPKATRKASQEIFVLGQGFRPKSLD